MRMDVIKEEQQPGVSPQVFQKILSDKIQFHLNRVGRWR